MHMAEFANRRLTETVHVKHYEPMVDLLPWILAAA
jgi:hypothetical protein